MNMQQCSTLTFPVKEGINGDKFLHMGCLDMMSQYHSKPKLPSLIICFCTLGKRTIE